MNNYADFDLDLREGEMYEQLVKRGLTGDITVEVKTDRLASTTGNVFIEYEYKSLPSGINNTKAEYYCIVIPQTKSFFFLPTEHLKTLMKGCRTVKGGDANLSRGYLVPLERLTK